jgi:hypothetical protein
MKAEISMRRISMMIREDQYERLNELGLNVSGLIRDLIDDHLSGHTVTISVQPDTQNLYQRVVSNTGATDELIEPYLRRALKELLAHTIEEMKKLHGSIE